MATLPRVTEPGITPNVDLVGAAGIGARAAANLGEAAARSAQQIGALVEAEIVEREEKYMAQAVLEADQLAIQGLEENDNPDAYNAWWEGVVEEQVANAPTRMAGDIELMFRRRGQREELNLRREALAQRRRETDLTRASAMDNIVEQMQTRIQNEGLEYMESPDYQADILQIQELAMLRAEADVANLPENYVEQAIAEVEQTTRLSAVGFAARAAFEQGRDLEQVREVVQEQLSQEVMSDAERRVAMSHIMGPVEDLDRERRRAIEDAFRARAGDIADARAESARGHYPSPSMTRFLASTEEGQAILDEITTNVEMYEFSQAYVTSDAAGRAAMVQDVEANATGVDYQNRMQAIQNGQSYINSMRDNPAGFVLSTDEEFATRYQEAIQSQEPARVIEYTTELLDRQRRAGWLEQDLRVLSEADAARMVNNFTLNPDDPNMRATMVAAVQNIDTMYGSHAPRVFEELGEAGLNPSALLIAETRWTDPATDTPHITAAAPLAERAADTTRRQREDAINGRPGSNQGSDDSDLNRIREEVASVVEPIVNTIDPQTPEALANRQRIRDTVYDLALQGFLETGDVRRSVQTAATAYTDRFQYVGTLRIPMSVDVRDIEFRLDDYMDGIDETRITPTDDTRLLSEAAPDFQLRAYASLVRQGGTWRTRQDDAGAVLYDHFNNPVIDAQTGQQVFVPWSDLPEPWESPIRTIPGGP